MYWMHLYKCWHISDVPTTNITKADYESPRSWAAADLPGFSKIGQEKNCSAILNVTISKYRPGLITIEGKLVKGVRIEDADAAVKEELRLLMEQGITEQELEKVKNKTESAMAFEDMSLLNRASSIAMYELLATPLSIPSYPVIISVSAADILQASRKILTKKW